MLSPTSFEMVPNGAILGQQRERKQRNPSARHQALLSMVKLFPETALRLAVPHLDLAYVISGPLQARVGDADAHGLRIDTTMEYTDTSGRVVLALVIEAQLSGEADLRWRIPAYAGFVFHDLRCATGVLIICQTSTVADRLAQPVRLGMCGSSVTPKTIGPADIPIIASVMEAMFDPGRMLLSAWYHARRGRNGDGLLRLLAQVTALLAEIDQEKAQRYHECAVSILSNPVARRFNEMTSLDVVREYVGKNFYPQYWEPAHKEGLESGLKQGLEQGVKQGLEQGVKQGREQGVKQGREQGVKQGREQGRKQGVKQGLKQGQTEGLLDGRRRDILIVLEERGIDVPAKIRKRILGCTESELLTRWLQRSATAATAEEVVAPGS